MDTFETIFTRRSVRRYRDVPVEWEKVGHVLEAGRAAPSAGNLQNWRFIVVTSGGQRDGIAEASLNQKWMAKAPVHIVVTSEVKKVEIFYGLRGERLYSVQNCAAAIQNMLLAAHAQGLGACWVGAFDEDMVRRICGIPGQSRPQAIITLGYEEGKAKDPGRTALYTVTFVGGYGGRIRDFNRMMGYTSDKVQKAFGKAKETVEKSSSTFDKLFAKGKEALKKKGK